MIFTPEHVQMIIEGRKTQTRRVVKSGDELRQWDVNTPMVYYVDDGWCGHEGPGPACYPGRVKWVVGRTYAVQPGRGKPAVARIRITEIRREKLMNISHADAQAEGYEGIYISDALPYADYTNFMDGWNAINKRKGTRWQDNPLVWVLDFEVVR